MSAGAVRGLPRLLRPAVRHWAMPRQFSLAGAGAGKDKEPKTGLAAKPMKERLAAEQGYFHEMMQLQKTKGKPFVADTSVIPAAEARVFPSLTAETLVDSELSLPADCRGKVTLVALSFKQFGYVQLASWIAPFQHAALELRVGGGSSRASRKSGGGAPAVQVLQVSAMEGGFINSLLKGSVKSGLVRSTPAAMQASSAVFVGDCDPLCEGLGVENRLLGWAFLVDADARVRWRGCGTALPEEIESLRSALSSVWKERG